jgi:hypothetical protein
MAVTQVLALKNVSSVWTSKSSLARNPPSSAPTMPTTAAIRRPRRSPVSFPATIPAMAPNTIQARMLMTVPLSALPEGIALPQEATDPSVPSPRSKPAAIAVNHLLRALPPRAVCSNRGRLVVPIL